MGATSSYVDGSAHGPSAPAPATGDETFAAIEAAGFTGRVDYDSAEADWAEWDAFFEMMDIAAVHWDGQVLKWLRERHPGRRRSA